ncbi:polycystin-1 [Lingula anatina]|uniref:Polycystin-1 n=1 Tax=Lingula anatina TaxID=7574 RepID=A0A1S3IB21_LINAN|nr:polycystin-1 [Lingula anatina]|eukprot:XP_013395465.1 polycystin-1 [Lingula anatina]
MSYPLLLGHAQETYNISVTNQYNASVDYTLSVLADASSTRYIHSNVREIHQSELYFDAGDIVSSVKSTHFFTGEEVLTSAVTKVYMPVQKLNLTCPSVATQNKPFFCKMTVQEGTNMAADVSVIGSGNRVTFQMPDTSIYTVGHMGGTAGSQTTHHSKIYILQNQIFKHEGLLKTVQYDAIATGTIIFQVYRPVCSSGSTFCMKSYNCIGSTAACQDQTDRWAITCASDQYFSFPGRTCRDRATNARIDWYFASDWNAMPVQTLELVGEYTHVISSTGLGFAVLDSSAIEVQPGDVFAFYMENTITIKHADSTVAEETYSDVGNNWGNRVPGEYQIPGSFSGSNTKHMVKAFVVRTVTTSFEYTFYNAGNVTLEAIVSNQDMLPGDQNYRAINDSVGIEVQAVIANLTFNFVSHVATNASVSFDIPAHPGSKVTYSWQFGDGHTEEVYQTRTMSHTYVSDGVYGITLFAWNDVSNMTTYGWISIQDTILDLVFEAGQVVTVQSYPTLVTWTIAYGTNVTYDIAFSDGNTYQLLHDAPPDIGVDGLHLGLSGALNHTFGDIGNYSVHLTASNAISSQSAMLYLPIQIPILDLYIEPPNPIPYDTEVTIVVTTTNGTNAVYESTFDGYPTRNLSMTLRTKTMTGVRQVPCTFTTAAPYAVTVYQNGSYPDVNETAAGGYYGGIMNETAAGGYGYTNVNESDDGYFYHNGTDGSYGYHNGTDGNYGYHNDSSAEGAAGGDYPGTTSIPMCDELYEYEVPDGHAIDGFVHIIPDDYYRTIGNYTLVVSGSNLVNFANASAVLWVDYLIENYTVEVEEFYITPGREINFTHAVYRASRFNLTADYADGFQHNLYRGVMLEPENIVLRHAWATADNYTVNLTMVNPVDNQTIQYEIIVQNAVEGLTLVTNSPVALYPNSVSVGLFEIHYDGVPLLGTDMFASYTFGDRSNITRYVIVNETTPHPTTHNYSVYGTYPITLNVSNYVSFMEFSTNLVVDQAILNMTIEPDPQFVQINTLCMVTVTVAWGTRLNLTWDFGDGTPTYTTDYKTNETNTEFHNYTTAGNFYITITAMNSVGTLIKTITDPIIIQFPVTGFMLTGRKQSLIEPPEWLVVVPFKFYHERAIPLPSNASYYIDYGDGTQSVTRPLPDHGDPALDDGDYEHMFSFDHGYSTGNVYTVTVVVFNLADNVTFTYDVDVFESITNLSKAVFAIEEDNNGTIILKAKGVGPGSIYYPLEKLVYLDVSMNRGSHVTYHWEFGDGFVQTVYNEPYIKYLYNEPGTYTIKLNASNPLNNVVIEKTIIVQRSCIDTEIWVEEPAPRNTTFNFQIYPGTIGSDACYFINFKDPMSDENYLAFLGNQAECEQTYPNSWALQPRRFVPYAASDLEAMRAPGQRLSLTFPHVFQTPGVWNVTMIAHNKVSRSESYWVSGVTRGG